VKITSTFIEHPPHYNSGRIEVIDFIEDQKLGFHLGNVVKYIARSTHKGHEIEDLQKARWYLNRRIWHLEQESSPAPNQRTARRRGAASTTKK
jgi:hypothetical protein